MARVLIVYHRQERKWLTPYLHNLHSLRRYSAHECFYFNAARSRMPAYLNSLQPDLIVFHYTLLLQREVPGEYRRILAMIDHLRHVACPKIMIAQDEQVRMDLLNAFVRDYGVTQIFTPTPAAQLPRVYAETDLESITFHPILTGYLDDATVKRVARRAAQHGARSIDVGYRSWYTRPFYGSHGQMKQRIGRVFKEAAPAHGLRVDISDRIEDAFWGDSWFDFLLDCRYTIGVEGGCSVFDWDGSIAQCTRDYARSHPTATYEEFEAACFPGLDGEFEYYLISPRHLEAVMTRTCQVLVEGEYAGVLRPGEHYIELKRDFSNLEDVFELMKDEGLRQRIVDQAYRDIVESGTWSYRAFVERLFAAALPASSDDPPPAACRRRINARLLLNRADDLLWVYWHPALWSVIGTVRHAIFLTNDWLKQTLRPIASKMLGEDRLKQMLASIRGPRGEKNPRGSD